VSIATVTARQAPRSHARRRHRTPVVALARAEGSRLLRHPIVLASMPFCVGTFLLLTWNQAPVLSRDDILIGLALCPLAGAVFLAAHLGATRSFRHGTDELYEGTVTTPAQRTAGHLLSVLWTIGLSVLLVVAGLLYLVALHAVARPDPLELLTGPSFVILAGVLGVALARWWRAALAGPVGVVALAAIEIFLAWQTQAGRSENNPNPVRWLAPWVPISVSGAPPRELVIRPTGWHLVFIASLAFVAGSVALLRAGVRPSRVAVTAGALALAVVAASAQVRAPTPAQRKQLAQVLVHPERYQVCQTRMGVRYCAYRSYAGWIDRWATAVTPVISRVPADARPTGVEILQTMSVYGSDVDEKELEGTRAAFQFGYNPTTDDLGAAITPTNQWGRGTYEGQDELAIDLIVAAQAVGLPRRPQDIRLTAAEARNILSTYDPADRKEAGKQIHAGGPWDYCRSAGQARAVVALWLAAQATSRTEAAFRAVLARDPYGITVVGTGAETDIRSGVDELNVFGGPMLGELEGLPYRLQIFNFVVQWGKGDAVYAEQLLNLPRAQVSAALSQNWAMLTRPTTTTDQLVQVLGLRPLPPYEQQLAKAGVPPDRAKNIIQNMTDPSNADPSLVPCP
jgi:hypothetical protein